ncbi:MAG TPA: DUF4824 family protein [Burkholderiales bacterium]
MIAWSRRRTLVAGIGLILAVNAVALAGVAYNRSGDPDSVLRLTQRELRPPYGWRSSAENSGVALTLHWRAPVEESADSRGWVSFGGGGSPAWLDKAKLASLGFETSPPKAAADGGRYYEKQLAREVLLVLELDGPAYRQSLERARQNAARAEASQAANAGNKDIERQAKLAKERATSEEREYTRLFAVDAGLDIGALRARYPDRARYAIVRGLVRPQLTSHDKEQRLSGYVSGLSVDQINLPVAFRQVVGYALQDNRAGRNNMPAPYEAEVAFGKRLEPWITAVSGKAGSQ